MSPVTIVTGGSRGIGAATARRLAADGHRVAIGYVRFADAAAAVVDDITRAGGTSLPVRVDPSVEADVVRLFGSAAAEIDARSGAPDGAESAAGRIPMGRAGEPEEIAEAVAWLLGPAASYTTGAILRVAGGM